MNNFTKHLDLHKNKIVILYKSWMIFMRRESLHPDFTPAYFNNSYFVIRYNYSSQSGVLCSCTGVI